MRALVGVAVTALFLALACGPAQPPAGTPLPTPSGGADVPQPPLKQPDATAPATDTPGVPAPLPGGGPGGALALVAAYQGNVRLNGQPATDELVGATVEAVVDDRVCGTGAILAPTQEGGVRATPYSALRVEFGRDSQDQPVCGRPGALIHFVVAGSWLAAERAEWKLGLNRIDLNAPGPAGAGAATVFQGKAVFMGGPAVDGVVIRAYVGANLCGMATTKGGSYALSLHGQESMSQCAKPGDPVTFTVGGRRAGQAGVSPPAGQRTVLDLASQ